MIADEQIEYKARPRKPVEGRDDPNVDPRDSEVFFLFEERVPAVSTLNAPTNQPTRQWAFILRGYPHGGHCLVQLPR